MVDAAASMLLGAACPGCGSPTARLCARCRGEIRAREAAAVVVRGVGVPVAASGPHEGVLRALVIAYKELQAWWLSADLGGLLEESVARALVDAD